MRDVLIAGWFDSCENFAVGRWYLHRQEPPFAAPYDVEGDAHALRERLGIMASFVFSHDSVPQINNALVRVLLSRYGTSGWRESFMFGRSRIEQLTT
jgi:hypothetical protein